MSEDVTFARIANRAVEDVASIQKQLKALQDNLTIQIDGTVKNTSCGLRLADMDDYSRRFTRISEQVTEIARCFAMGKVADVK